MSLNLSQLESDLTNLFENAKNGSSEADFIKGLATAIDNYVKTGELSYTGGLVAPNGTVTGTINGNIK